MDEEEESFDDEPEENLEENEEENDDEDSEGEYAQRRAYESESDSEQAYIPKNQTSVIEKLESEIDQLTTKLENGEISFEKYNEMLIFNQMRVSDEKYKLMEFVKSDKVSKDLMSELDSLFSDLKKKKKQGKFDPGRVGDSIDDIFRKYGEALEKELIEDEEFFFESNPITSNITNVINLPVPEKYQKQLQVFEQKIVKNDISVEDIYNYLDLRLAILNDNLQTNLKHDILYVRFHMDLQMEFASLRSELELLVGETGVVIDEDIDEFNQKHNIKMGVLKSRKDILSNVKILKELLESKLLDLTKKYKITQDTVFKKQDSKEVLKIIKQLREIYTKNEYYKLERKFTDEEIIDDLKNKSLDFIIEKYAHYISSDYFSWAMGGKKEEILERPKYVKRGKISDKEMSTIKESEKREYFQRKEFEKILSTLPKEILLKCADKLIMEGKINEPYSQLTSQERFINELYTKAVPICVFSRYYSDDIKEYTKEVNKITDEFMISPHILEASWKLGPKVSIGDSVYVDRTNELIRKTMDEMTSIQNKINKFNRDIEKTMGSYKIDMYLNKLRQKLTQLELSLNSFNRYKRAPQLGGVVVGLGEGTIDVKLFGTSHIRTFPNTYVSRYSKSLKEPMPLYTVIDSDAFNPISPLKGTSTHAISKWIRTVLKDVIFGITFDINNKEQAIELYDKALETYKNLSETEKAAINAKVISGMHPSYVSQFKDGIPSKGPLIFVFPPAIPDNPEKGEPNLEEFVEYSKKLNEYVKNLTPETNPFVKMGVPVTNQIMSNISGKVYSNLQTAIKNTPVNGFFKLSSLRASFKSLVLNYLQESEKKALQRMLLSQDEIKDFMDSFFTNQEETEKTKKAHAQMQYKPTVNPKITLVNELKTTLDQDDYVKLVSKIDKDIKITKIVGEEVYVDGRTKPISKISLEKMLMGSLSRDYQIAPTNISMKEDPISSSIEWGLMRNPTFQLLDLSKKLRGSFIVHTEPKYRIRVVEPSGHFYSGWVINPIKEIIDKQTVHVYKYPIIITDFTEYLKLHRNSLVIKYENFRQLDVLTYEEFTSSNYILRHITYISEYLKNIGQEDGFTIDLIKQQDAHLKIRQEQRAELLEALLFMYGSLVDKDTLQNIANEIELEVYTSFQDIARGDSERKTTSILNTEHNEHFQLLKKFRKSNLPFTYVTKAFMTSMNRSVYEIYLYRISISVFNIYRTNNFIQDYIEGKIKLDSLIYRDLTKAEITEGSDTIENLVSWSPPTEVLSVMRKEHPEVYDRVIRDGPDIVEVSVITRYEQEIKQTMSVLNKKLALIELVRLKSWQKTLAMLENIEDSKKLMFLIKHRNDLRTINNITAGVRLYAFVNINAAALNCKILDIEIQQNRDIIEEYAENIEIACYSLSSNKEEYDNLFKNIIGSKAKLCKLISEFVAIANKGGNVGPVDIIANIAELYLEIGKIQSGAAILKKAKLGDWDGIKQLPNEILTGIKKVANSMTEIHTKYVSRKTEFRKDNEGVSFPVEKLIKTEEFKVIKDSEGKFMIKQIFKPIVIDEKKKQMSMFLQMIKRNYVPRVNDILSTEIQKIIDKNELTEEIIDELNSREGINSKDIQKLKSMNYEQLLDINANFHREPIFTDVIPLTVAKKGIRVYPIKSRGGFLIGGNFPLDPKAYRYRDSDGNIRSRLIEICGWVGITSKSFKTQEIVLNAGLRKLDSIYSNTKVQFEEGMLSCIKKLLDSAILVKIYGQDLLNSKEVLSKVITEFDMYKSIEESVVKYFNEFGGNKKLFANGGTKEEYDSFLSNTLYAEAMQRLIGVPTLIKKKEVYGSKIISDDRVDVSILKNGDQEVYRKLYKSKTQMYPVPIRYDSNNYPVYAKNQKMQLAFLIEAGHISPWYKNKITITKTKGDIWFDGDLPFVIDESVKDSRGESNYYVEQIFRDPMYGLPIVTRIGIIPKRIKGAEGQNIIKKIRLPENKFVVKEEPFKVKYFRSEVPSQSQVNDFRLSEAQKPQPLNSKDLARKSGYSIIDSRMLSYSVKYNPDDVWSWDPLKDYKVGAQKDNDIWVAEKNRQTAELKEWLRKAGSSSSAFIAAKNEATRYLQMFRINLPSQKRNEISQTRYKKPVKSARETNIINIGKTWKKYPKDKLLNEAKRIGFYTNDMDRMKAVDILSKMKSKLEEESKKERKIEEERKIGEEINKISIIQKIGVVKDINIDEHVKTAKKLEEYATISGYIDSLKKHQFIIISPEVMKVIENPKILFPNYNRYEISFNDTGYVAFYPKYGQDGPYTNDTVNETIYEIIKNMSYTTNFGFDGQIVDYVNDLSLFEKLGNEEKLELMSQFPILKVIIKIKQKGLKITIWNLLTTAYDMWYPRFYRGMKKELIENIKKRTFKYSFEQPIEITLEDVVNYLGDSYCQNSRYDKGIKYEMIAKKYTGNVLYLQPGYKFEKINSDEVSFVDKTSSVAKYTQNSYITLFRNVDVKDPKISIEMLVVGDELHNNTVAVTSNLARRRALLYNVEPANIDPMFNIPDPNITGRYRDVAVNADDVTKFMAKGGNYYTILEIPDAELKFRKLPTGDKMTAINHYRAAVKEYFKSKDKKKTYTDFVQKKRLNPLTLNIYINKVEEAKLAQGQVSHFIDTLAILPDFLDIKWPFRKKYIEKEFIEKTHISLDNYLNGEKRDIYMNVPRPTKRLFAV